MMRRAAAWLMVALGLAGLWSREAAAGDGYDPLKVKEGWTPKTVNLDVRDESRSRTLPIKVYLPESQLPAPVVLFSHGLGGSRENNPYLGNHWSGRGYVVVFIQHPGSDESVWRDAPLRQRMTAMREAANLENTVLRLRDVPAVIDQLERWETEEGSPLKGRMNLKAIGMSGHSFGAVTTQGVSGQRAARGTGFTEKRITAAVAMSPSAPVVGDTARAFGEVSIPWLLMTGTKDVAAVGNTTVENRLSVYPALPAGNKYELVLKDAEHMAFGERALRAADGKRNPNHHRVILGLSTAFWDAYLRDDAAARTWLDGDGPKSVLEADDRWQRK